MLNKIIIKEKKLSDSEFSKDIYCVKDKDYTKNISNSCIIYLIKKKNGSYMAYIKAKCIKCKNIKTTFLNNDDKKKYFNI